MFTHHPDSQESHTLTVFTHNHLHFGHTITEVISMSYVSDEIRPKFDTLSIDLKNEILKRDVPLNTIHDLIRVLEDIVAESEN